MPEPWTQHALRALSSAGYRVGGAREAVVGLLGAHGGCLTAEEIGRELEGAGRPVGMASVYRALTLLEELGLLQRVALGHGAIRYDLVGAGGEHHHHIVCRGCGSTVAFDDPSLESAIDDLSARVRHRIDSHDVTLRGICPDCRPGPG